MNYENITDMKVAFVDGQENPSGVGELAYLIPYSWFETIQEPTASTTSSSIVTITADHVLKASKAPIEVQALYEKSGMTSALEGEILSKIFKTGVELFIPNHTAANIGTATALKNYRFILLIRRSDQNNGFLQIGSKSIAAYVEAIDANLGTGPTGEVGIKLTVGAYGKAPYLFYDGELPAPAPVGG